MNSSYSRLALSVQMALTQQNFLFFRRCIERNFLLTSRQRVGLTALWLLLVLATPGVAESRPTGSRSSVPPETKQRLAKVQIPFIANEGQTEKEVKFYTRTFGRTVSVTDRGTLVYSLPKLEGNKRIGAAALKEELVGGKIAEVKGESEAVTKVSYFKGNDRSKWKSNVSTYNFVSLGEVYEGVEVKLKAYANNVEKLFYVKPGAEPVRSTTGVSLVGSAM